MNTPTPPAPGRTTLDQASAALVVLYEALDRDITRAGPTCELSGRCCRFEAYGHTLFVSRLEVDHLLATAPTPIRPLDTGQTCPWQDPHNRCTARAARPLGCRVYFCDPTFSDASARLSEHYIRALKRITDDLGRPWHYAPLHTHLAQAQTDGRVAFPTSVNPPSETSARDLVKPPEHPPSDQQTTQTT